MWQKKCDLEELSQRYALFKIDICVYRGCDAAEAGLAGASGCSAGVSLSGFLGVIWSGYLMRVW